MQEKRSSKNSSRQLRQNPLAGLEQQKSSGRNKNTQSDEMLPSALSQSIMKQAREQRDEDALSEDDDDNDDAQLDMEDDEDALQALNEHYVYKEGADDEEIIELDDAEEELVGKFLSAGLSETRTLADIIMEKLKEKEMENDAQQNDESNDPIIPAKVSEVYHSVGTMLQHYKSGKLPKALKMLPHLKNWEHILWLTRPDLWSPCSTFAVTRIFASNLNVKMAQRFFNLVLLEKCRDDIRSNNKLNYHLYMALKKALFKPAAFYKGILLPLAQSGTCTLREAVIFGSVIAKVSVPAIHSAAALLRLTEIEFNGTTSVFIKVLLSKKYALPRRVLDALFAHFVSFADESRELPVVWHQSLLVFVQRYKFELTSEEISSIFELVRKQNHREITNEIRRELLNNRPKN